MGIVMKQKPDFLRIARQLESQAETVGSERTKKEYERCAQQAHERAHRIKAKMLKGAKL